MKTLPPCDSHTNFVRLAGIFFLLPYLAACSAHFSPTTRVTIPNATINGHPARLLLDTGTETSLLYGSGAGRLGVKLDTAATAGPKPPGSISVGLTEKMTIAVGKQNFIAPLPEYQAPWLASLALTLSNSDGLIGWPQVRDNILQFDAAHRTIRALDTLPPETSGWMKFKLHRGDLLMLDVPQADGTTACVLIDTGSPFGIILEPSRWAAWHAAHPNAAASSEEYFMPFTGPGPVKTPEAWADRVRIGGLELTDLPVQGGVPRQFAALYHGAAVLGLYALARMDLIVDGKNSVAYLHPKSAPGPFYPGFARAGYGKGDPGPDNDDWTLADNVHLNDVQLQLVPFFFSAERKIAAGNYPAAIADYTHILQYDPLNYKALRNRGMANQCIGDPHAALSDYQNAIAAEPDDGPRQTHYLRLYRQLLLMQLGPPSSTTFSDFAATFADWTGQWPKMLAQFIAGQLDESALLAAAEKPRYSPPIGQKCEAYYFIGTVRMLKGDLTGARDNWAKCLATGQKSYVEYRFAQAALDRTKSPQTPAFPFVSPKSAP